MPKFEKDPWYWKHVLLPLCFFYLRSKLGRDLARFIVARINIVPDNFLGFKLHVNDDVYILVDENSSLRWNVAQGKAWLVKPLESCCECLRPVIFSYGIYYCPFHGAKDCCDFYVRNRAFGNRTTCQRFQKGPVICYDGTAWYNDPRLKRAK